MEGEEGGERIEGHLKTLLVPLALYQLCKAVQTLTFKAGLPGLDQLTHLNGNERFLQTSLLSNESTLKTFRCDDLIGQCGEVGAYGMFS